MKHFTLISNGSTILPFVQLMISLFIRHGILHSPEVDLGQINQPTTLVDTRLTRFARLDRTRLARPFFESIAKRSFKQVPKFLK